MRTVKGSVAIFIEDTNHTGGKSENNRADSLFLVIFQNKNTERMEEKKLIKTPEKRRGKEKRDESPSISSGYHGKNLESMKSGALSKPSLKANEYPI